MTTVQLSDDDRRALTEMSYRYASLVDGRRFDDLVDLFTVDAVLITPYGRREGHDEIRRVMQGLERYDRTFHLVGQVRHWVDAETVRGETYCVAHHFVDEFVDEVPITRDRVMYIRYHDEFVGGHTWRIGRRELDVVWSGQEDKAGPSA